MKLDKIIFIENFQPVPVDRNPALLKFIDQINRYYTYYIEDINAAGGYVEAELVKDKLKSHNVKNVPQSLLDAMDNAD
jgi:hypothetical protein